MSSNRNKQIQTYIQVRIGSLSNRGLVNVAIDMLAKPEPPSWAVELASLGPSEILDACRVLEAQLHHVNVLPDSDELRSQIRSMAKDWASRVLETNELEGDEPQKAIIRILRVCPDYQFGKLSIPIEEYPYPPSNVETPSALASYVLNELYNLVPRYALEQSGAADGPPASRAARS